MAGKGDKRRASSIPRAEMHRRWDDIDWDKDDAALDARKICAMFIIVMVVALWVWLGLRG